MNYDFTLKTYRKLLEAILSSGYTIVPFEEWCGGKVSGNFVILRHDVDLKAGNSLETAKIEASMGIRASYYFRVVPQSNQPDIIKAIAALGHEIGYHYEDLSLFAGNKEKAIEHFKNQLDYFRQFYPLKTICMHGSPASRIDNRSIWTEYNYKNFEIIGEPYFDFLNRDEVLYLTDTARMWDGDKFNFRDKKILSSTKKPTTISEVKSQHSVIHSTFDLIHWFNNSTTRENIMITTHPQRWTDNLIPWVQELILQNLKNQIKRLLILLR